MDGAAGMAAGSTDEQENRPLWCPGEGVGWMRQPGGKEWRKAFSEKDSEV